MLVRWPSEPYNYFPAQVTNWKINENVKSYDVYFPEDSETLMNVPINDLKAPPAHLRWSKMKRPDYVGFNFLHQVRHERAPNKFGQFEITGLGIFPNHNTYVCQLINDSRGYDEEEYYFDVGYVQRLLVDS